jgi:hypothetical protein
MNKVIGYGFRKHNKLCKERKTVLDVLLLFQLLNELDEVTWRD